ncbi:MAG: paiB [Pseudonocardiales bacterium]|nr:paiB [Pseudonocardiales bacterium]
MYIPAHFAGPDDALPTLLRSSPLADLVTSTPDALIATPLPLLFEPSVGDHGALHGHVARNNPHWAAGLTAGGAPSIAILRGPDAYISPNWYAAKAEHGRVVPTWNYLTVHVHGRLIAHDDPAWTEALVRRLTDHFEAGQPAPWSVDDAPAAYIRGQVRAIVGVELLITSIEAKYKLSQNRSEADQAGVVQGLRDGTAGEQALGDRMTAGS